MFKLNHWIYLNSMKYPAAPHALVKAHNSISSWNAPFCIALDNIIILNWNVVAHITHILVVANVSYGTPQTKLQLWLSKERTKIAVYQTQIERRF